MTTAPTPNKTSADDPIIRFAGVGLRRGPALEVFRDLNFELKAGSFHILTGAAGAGKTSLLALIRMSLAPTAGEVSIFGVDVAGAGAAERTRLRRRIGMVHTDARLLMHLSAFDNAVLPLRIARLPPADYGADVAELLTWLGLGERMDAYPADLSGSELRRLAIARAVVGRPDILLADDPTGGLDEATAARILRLFDELNRHGATVLIAANDQSLIERADRPVLRLADEGLTFMGRVRRP